MRTVVTGGAGFIGSTLVDQLIAAGHSVTVIDNFSSGSAENLEPARDRAGERLAIHAVDIRDAQTITTIVEAQPDVVYHLAAQADVRVSVNNPVLDAQINVIGTLHVLEGARRAGARKIVAASSGGTIYGEPSPQRVACRRAVPATSRVAVRGQQEGARRLHVRLPSAPPTRLHRTRTRQCVRAAPRPTRRSRRRRDLRRAVADTRSRARCSAPASRRATTCTSPT